MGCATSKKADDACQKVVEVSKAAADGAPLEKVSLATVDAEAAPDKQRSDSLNAYATHRVAADPIDAWKHDRAIRERMHSVRQARLLREACERVASAVKIQAVYGGQEGRAPKVSNEPLVSVAGAIARANSFADAPKLPTTAPLSPSVSSTASSVPPSPLLVATGADTAPPDVSEEEEAAVKVPTEVELAAQVLAEKIAAKLGCSLPSGDTLRGSPLSMAHFRPSEPASAARKETSRDARRRERPSTESVGSLDSAGNVDEERDEGENEWLAGHLALVRSQSSLHSRSPKTHGSGKAGKGKKKGSKRSGGSAHARKSCGGTDDASSKGMAAVLVAGA